MSENQAERLVTYGDVFPGAQQQEGVSAEAVTMEDAALMQSAEALAFGRSAKGGAGSLMQSAAAKNVKRGLIDKDAHSVVAEYGLSAVKTSVPGAVMDVEYVAGTPVTLSFEPTPTFEQIGENEGITIGEALEAAALGSRGKPIDASDARAILSAEKRATGSSAPMRGGIGAISQSAAELNTRVKNSEKTTLEDVLTDASSELYRDKLVTYEDAHKVMEAERRGDDGKQNDTASIGSAILNAATLNEEAGLIGPPSSATWQPITNAGEELQNYNYTPLSSMSSGAIDERPSPTSSLEGNENFSIDLNVSGETTLHTLPTSEELQDSILEHTPLRPDMADSHAAALKKTE